MSADLQMHFGPRGSLLEAAHACEAEVFLTWFGNTREQLTEEYGDYEDRSKFLVLADENDDVLACARLISPGGPRGLKTVVDMGRPPWGVDGARAAAAVGVDLGSTWEVATLGVRTGLAAAGPRLSLALYHGLVTITRVNRATSLVAILDDRVQRLLNSVGLRMRQFPGTAAAPYLGSSSSTPVYAHCSPALADQRRRFPDAHRLITLGVGLDGITVPPPDAFLLVPPAEPVRLHELAAEDRLPLVASAHVR